MVQLFLDCDGVLADFDTYAEDYFGMPPREYERIMGSSRFWDALEAKGDIGDSPAPCLKQTQKEDVTT